MWLLYGLHLFWRAITGALVGLVAAIRWLFTSFARLSPAGKLATLVATGALVLVMAVFDVPFLEPTSARSVADGYVRPAFDPDDFAAEQAQEAESHRTREFPLYMYEMCAEILTDGPGPQEYWRGFSTLSDRPITYQDALQIIADAEEGCAEMGVTTAQLDRVRKISSRSRILFDKD